MRGRRILLSGSAIVFALAFGFAVRTHATGTPSPNPSAVRTAARAAGLDSLARVPVPIVPNMGAFLNPGPAALQSALILGKAFFWDMQVGSDGQACGSCHFHAGADSREKNQLNPGLRGNPPDQTFGLLIGGYSRLGPNYTLTPGDFPFHLLSDPDSTNFSGRVVLRDTNDVVSSQGVFKANFVGVSGTATDKGTAVADPIFNVMGVNTRRVEPRNTPTMINAVFNSDNFWDGRARNQFNGVTPLGLLDTNAKILVNENGMLKKVSVVIPNSSLASQAVGPPLSPDEMSFVDRTSQDVGHKLFQRRRGRRLLPLRPLALQRVHAQDSVLGPVSAGPLKGLTFTSYADLVMLAFQSKYWNSLQLSTFDIDGNELLVNPPVLPGVEAFKQMEANFSLFFGLAVQIYESTLISDKTPFDRFMEGDDYALAPDQLRGLLAFINTGEADQASNPIFYGVSQANCVACHSGPEFTEASFTGIADQGGLIEIEEIAELIGGEMVEQETTAFLDTGFANIGVRPTAEDLARGGLELNKPLSHVRQRLAGFSFAPPLPNCGVAPDPPCPPGFPSYPRVQVDGAFKVPGLRNSELTGPYFHNGGQATLRQVVEFYNRHGDFGDRNIANINGSLANVAIKEDDEDRLVAFLIALTDGRVRNEKAPFDHPEIFVPGGHPGDDIAITCFTMVNGVKQACDARFTSPAVGSNGRAAEGLPPLGTFLGLPPSQP